MKKKRPEDYGKNGNNDERRIRLASSMEENISFLRDRLGPSTDLTIRRLVHQGSQTPFAAVYMDGLTDKQTLNEILRSVLEDTGEVSGTKQDKTEDREPHENKNQSVLMNRIEERIITATEMIEDLDSAILGILSGDTLLMIEGISGALSCSTQGGESRAISEPSSQIVIRGPRDGFTESIGTNVSLVRRRIKSSDLWLEKMKIGSITQTDVAIMYLKGIANREILDEVRKRLKAIDFDSVLETGYIENLIQEASVSPFPTMFNTERPDTVAANLLEGRVAIFVDGTPFVLVAPTTFFMFFQAPEDYYQRTDVSTAVRILRYFALFISMFGPSIYIAAITYHQEMIPTPLLISLATQRESVPFPALVEAMIMEITFEILREAGIRMPRAIGQAVSIVGALVLGQAAVQAGIVSSAMVIVVALTGISSFTTPSFSLGLSIRLLRFVIMLFAAFLGFFGIVIFSLFLAGHLCGLRSFGVPYMAPVAPFDLEGQKDTFIRSALRSLSVRPKFLQAGKKYRKDIK